MAIRRSAPAGRGKDDPTFGPGRMPSEMTPGPVLDGHCWICDSLGKELKKGVFGCPSCGVGWAANPDSIWHRDGVRGVKFWEIGIATVLMGQIGTDVRSRYDGSWDTHLDGSTRSSVVPRHLHHGITLTGVA